jgi:hypothetical protein
MSINPQVMRRAAPAVTAEQLAVDIIGTAFKAQPEQVEQPAAVVTVNAAFAG